MMSIALVILAAGQGSRMQSDLPKVLHQIGNAPLFVHALASAVDLEPARIIMVTGHGAEQVEAATLQVNEAIQFARQEAQLGTGHAVLQTQALLQDFDGDVVVLYGDTPFVRPETLALMLTAKTRHDLVVLGFHAPLDSRYGRLKTQGDRLTHIVEWKEATPEEQAISLCNSGIMIVTADTLFDLLSKVTNDNSANEYYLTDIVELANTAGFSATAVVCDIQETLGINTRAELAAAEVAFQQRCRAECIENGVNMTAPDTVYFSFDTVIGRDATVEPFVVFGPDVTIESEARIRAFSHLEGAHVGAGAIIGPYARLRPGAEISDNAHIGNFVEVKNAQIGESAKVNHLSYIGDAFIGEATNIGAGTITCNYDGVFKHHTHIGARTFIGSNTMLIAPVSVGDEAMTASGTIVTKDVPDGDLAISRSPQENKSGFARKLMSKLKAAKAAKTKA
jgi:bifunctional UDP-N-acetylglucosamine pyrophosphorylase / glucosamine-1-phosphate N-acetyltransferase